jgi:hypothetical protein
MFHSNLRKILKLLSGSYYGLLRCGNQFSSQNHHICLDVHATNAKMQTVSMCEELVIIFFPGKSYVNTVGTYIFIMHRLCTWDVGLNQGYKMRI